jgi:curved DNA-binding protein CbpA
MIDYFALLQQPRRPWLDPGKLKEKYHQLTIETHPDRQLSKTDGVSPPDFANVNEAYRVLSDPKLRLQHLLVLQGASAANADAVPQALSDVFLETGTLIQEIDRLLARSTSTSLSKALLRLEVLEKQKLAADQLEKLQSMHKTAIKELQAIDQGWVSNPELAPRLSELSSTFAYLGRWITQLEERQFQLSI